MIRAGVFVSILIYVYKTKTRCHKFSGSIVKRKTEYGICSIQQLKDNQSIPKIQLALYGFSVVVSFFFQRLNSIPVLEMIVCMGRQVKMDDILSLFCSVITETSLSSIRARRFC